MKDRWLKAAYTDDKVVAELLLRLHQPPPSTPSSSSSNQSLPAWGHKQQRSTPLRKYSATRFSPRTPLSWSGGAATASPSDGGCDDSSVSSASRSKNFSQLKEETELLEERVNLKRDLKSVYVNLKEQGNKSENMKRIKFNLNQQSIGGALSTELEVISVNHQSKMETVTSNLHQSILPRHAIKEERLLANSCGGLQEVAESSKRGFVVPDLNMPVEDDEMAANFW